MPVALNDARVLGVPLAWFPRLMAASPAERETVGIGAFGPQWEALDEDVSVKSLLAGRGDRTARSRRWRRVDRSAPYTVMINKVGRLTPTLSSLFPSLLPVGRKDGLARRRKKCMSPSRISASVSAHRFYHTMHSSSTRN